MTDSNTRADARVRGLRTLIQALVVGVVLAVVPVVLDATGAAGGISDVDWASVADRAALLALNGACMALLAWAQRSVGR